MNVAELIDILSDLDPESSVEMAIVAPVGKGSDEITVDQYEVEGILPRDPGDHDGAMVVWLIGGEPQDVEEFIDAIGGEEDPMHTAHQAEVIDLGRAAQARRT